MPMEHRAREAVDAFMTRVRHDLDGHLQDLTANLLQLVEGRPDADSTSPAPLDAMRPQLRPEPGPADTEEMEEEASARRDRRLDTLARLLAAVRRLDEAGSLSSTLEALANAAAAETSRVAILIVDGDMLKVWGHFGFASSAAPVDTPLGQAGMLTAAVERRQALRVPPLLDPGDSVGQAGQAGLIVPIVVGAEVVALLYADDVDRLPGQQDPSIWTEEVELLVRHASLRLENVTSARTVEVLTNPV
jgi:hypothetical protein